MFFMKLLGRFFPSLYLQTQKTDDLIDAYRLGQRGLSSAILSPDAWLRLLKSTNRIQEELYHRDPEWDC
jgi:hypothetical protein